jgi:hypothetical protein
VSLVFNSDFCHVFTQVPFVRHTEEYYRVFANQWVASDPVAVYLCKVREMVALLSFLFPSS